MSITDILQKGVQDGVLELYGQDVTPEQVTLTPTRREFVGDFTVVVFPFTRAARKKPELIGEELGTFLVQNIEEVEAYNVIKGFLNLEVSNAYWNNFLNEVADLEDFGKQPSNGEKAMVEFSSPNTNKPLHLGHVRNILLGWSCAKILEAAGYEVTKVQIVNDRGIAICKSMLAWQLYGNGVTPADKKVKSDHFVGDYYVLFEQKFQAEYKAWQQTEAAKNIYQTTAKDGQSEDAFFKFYKNTYFNQHSELGKQAREMLLKWEANDPTVRALWEKMNAWVYAGFEETYQQLGVDFDKLYFESNTYLAGLDSVQKGLEEGLFYKKEDGSVWVDLTDAKLDHKILLRSDGTSVYMTQDLGTAQLRYQDFGVNRMIYVVADEQNYHFQVLFETLKRMGEPYADGLHHLSYGMVDLPTGKMKSREGTVVDADDLMAEVIEEASKAAAETGGIADLPKAQQEDIVRKIGLAALKYYIIKVTPQKRMTFNPKESVDLQGQTGPYIQYSYVRTKGVIKKAEQDGIDLEKVVDYIELEPLEKEMILQLYQFPEVIQLAAENYDPSSIANYCYALAKTYSKFWHDLPIFKAEAAAMAFRLKLCKATGNVLKTGMDLLGIEMPEKM